MKIGDLSRRTGVSVRMLRYYESLGLLAALRTRAGYRLYEDSAVETVRRIRLLSEAGLPLDEVRQILPCVHDHILAFRPCAQIREYLGDQLKRIDEKIEDLAKSRKLISGFLDGVEKASDAPAADTREIGRSKRVQ
jgi:DNA-binding transcriptional MerR regulator